MSELAPDLRSRLARVIVKARAVAEAGARKALEALAVERHEPHSSMLPDARKLRNRLRAHGRQLGDVRDRQRGSQSIDKLEHEVAYEHWHRMLFARFLSENGLLIHPEHNVALSSAEIEELARETGDDPHQMAARFAQDSLPQIFRADDPVLEVTLAPEARQRLESLLDSLPAAVYTADDSLGWTYQYWQAEKKDAVNASGEKIGADALPAVTQLFTEHYMVMFLYHNTLGAWHAGKVLFENPSIAETAKGEDELRSAVALKTDAGDSNWEYLRFVREPREGDEDDSPTGPWRPAAGSFEGWPRTAKELKILDPCCGSGHFLVAGFKLLVRMRMFEEGLDLETAINAVLLDNLFGLELDSRCTQIAAFNLALAAWRWVGKPIELPPLNIACSGISIGSSKKDWFALAGDDERLAAGLAQLYELFRQAPELGSLINPKGLDDDMFVADFSELRPLLDRALARESGNDEIFERAVAAQGMAKAAEILAGDCTLVITNVPYLARGKQSQILTEFGQRRHPAAKADLATMFIDRLLNQVTDGGSVACVTPQNWLFLDAYRRFRQKLIEQYTWNIVSRLGAKAFVTPMWDFNVMLLCLSSIKPIASHSIASIDAAIGRSAEEKTALVKGKCIETLDHYRQSLTILLPNQLSQLSNPNTIVTHERVSQAGLLKDFVCYSNGIQSGDSNRFCVKFWEPKLARGIWEYHQTTTGKSKLYAGMSSVFRWEEGKGDYWKYVTARLGEGAQQAWVRGRDFWGKLGVAISSTGTITVALYSGQTWNDSTIVLLPKDFEDLPSLWAFCSDPAFESNVRKLDQKLNVRGALTKVPFDIPHWRGIAADKYPYGLPSPQTDDPTQWLFHGHPANAEPSTILQIGVCRLLGYCWPPEHDDEIQLADEAREWTARCDDLKQFADADGIVCLPAIRSEPMAAERLRRLLSTALGPAWSSAKERELLAAAVREGSKPAASLETWLRDRFFEEHCKLFHHRPFVWHIWDGNRDGFHCLVNAHKLSGPDGEGRRTLEAITYSYLGDWIERQRDDQKTMAEGADARLAAALDLRAQLENILKGESPYDLFVRWKPLHEQAIGWDPDINDGVRLNIRPFMNAEFRKGGKKGAGILRWKPNIKWNKDRGKEPESLRPKDGFPWFWGCKGDGSEADRTDYTAESAARAAFDGDRWNDLHYSRVVKEAARVAAKNRAGESADS